MRSRVRSLNPVGGYFFKASFPFFFFFLVLFGRNFFHSFPTSTHPLIKWIKHIIKKWISRLCYLYFKLFEMYNFIMSESKSICNKYSAYVWIGRKQWNPWVISWQSFTTMAIHHILNYRHSSHHILNYRRSSSHMKYFWSNSSVNGLDNAQISYGLMNERIWWALIGKCFSLNRPWLISVPFDPT